MTANIGLRHRWKYRSHWREQKVARGRWHFNVRQIKHRLGRQIRTFHSAPRGTVFTWRIRAIQRLRKVSPNTYRGTMRGVKHFVRRSRS